MQSLSETSFSTKHALQRLTCRPVRSLRWRAVCYQPTQNEGARSPDARARHAARWAHEPGLREGSSSEQQQWADSAGSDPAPVDRFTLYLQRRQQQLEQLADKEARQQQQRQRRQQQQLRYHQEHWQAGGLSTGFPVPTNYADPLRRLAAQQAQQRHQAELGVEELGAAGSELRHRRNAAGIKQQQITAVDTAAAASPLHGTSTSGRETLPPTHHHHQQQQQQELGGGGNDAPVRPVFRAAPYLAELHRERQRSSTTRLLILDEGRWCLGGDQGGWVGGWVGGKGGVAGSLPAMR
jgi:hypothetical protein